MKTGVKLSLGIAVFAALVSVVIFVSGLSERGDDSSAEKTEEAENAVKKKGKDRRRGKTVGIIKPKIRKRKTVSGDVQDDGISDVDRRIIESLQDAKDNENVDLVRLSAKKAFASQNPEVRLQAINALEWFDEKVIPELVGAMADADNEVAAAARGSVENILMGMDDYAKVFKVSSSLMSVFRNDAETLTMLGGILSNSAESYIDPADDSDAAVSLAKRNRYEVIETLSLLINGGGAAAEEGKDVYETITGEPWRGNSEAKRWAKDPESYEPPNDDK
jgi:hypothetical protein